jgi:membrane-associated phospholipid phosphatase
VPTAVALIMLAFGTWRRFLLVACSASFSSIIAQVLKRVFFHDALRPVEFADRMPDLRMVEGVVLHHQNSFPSGHATAAFSCCLALAILFPTQGRAFLLACLASVIAFSRIYLSQHFTVDVVAGAAIGMATTLFCWYLWYRRSTLESRWLDRRPFRKVAVA